MVLHHQYDDSVVYAAFPRRFTHETTSSAYGLAFFAHFATGMMCEPAFQGEPGRSTTFTERSYPCKVTQTFAYGVLDKSVEDEGK